MTKPEDNKNKGRAPLPMLEKRRIEAVIIKNVFDVLEQRHGREEAKEVISQAVIKSSIEQGKEFRKQHGDEPDLKDFAALSSLWEMGGVLESLPRKYCYVFNMLRCTGQWLEESIGLQILETLGFRKK